jgi:hypothetical protein
MPKGDDDDNEEEEEEEEEYSSSGDLLHLASSSDFEVLLFKGGKINIIVGKREDDVGV